MGVGSSAFGLSPCLGSSEIVAAGSLDGTLVESLGGTWEGSLDPTFEGRSLFPTSGSRGPGALALLVCVDGYPNILVVGLAAGLGGSVTWAG